MSPLNETPKPAKTVKSGKPAKTAKSGKNVATLSTPSGGGCDTILTKDWVNKPFVIVAAEPIQTQYGDAYRLTGHAPKSKAEVTALCGASVLVKTLAQYIENEGTFPVQVKTVKAKGARYFTFE